MLRSAGARPLLAQRFELLRELGSGGMGEVWEAIDHELGARVAVKVLHERSGAAVELLKNEFRSVRDVRHRNLVKLGELIGGDRWFFTMELVEGNGLLHWLRPERGGGEAVLSNVYAPTIDQRPRRGAASSPDASRQRWDQHTAPFRPRYDEARLRDALAQITAALEVLHGHGIIHRDIKPSNVLVDATGRVVVLDFGLAISELAGGQSEMIAGTVEYMAPEQAAGRPITPAADFYAVGAILYEVLVGRPPFEGSIMEILQQKNSMGPIPPAVMFPETPRDLDRLCMQLLDPDPTKRGTSEGRGILQLEPRTARRRGGVRPTQPPELVRRDRDLARLLEIIDASTRTGGLSVTLLHGASGIGKSALLEVMCARAAAQGRLVLSGRCLEAEHIRYKAVDAIVDVLSRYLASLPPARRRSLVGPDDVALSRLFPAFERVAPLPSDGAPVTAEVAERLAIASLRQLLERLGLTAPIVLVVDDLHWSTPESLRFFLGVMAPPHPPQLAFFGGVRTSAHATEMFRKRTADMEMLSIEVNNLVLAPLGWADARQLATMLLGGDEARATEIASSARGVPLSITQLALEPLPAPSGGEPSGSPGAGVPVERMVGTLHADQLGVLTVVCAAIGPLSYESIASVLQVELPVLIGCVDELRLQGLVKSTGVRRGDVVEPFHDQVRDAVSSLVTPAQLALAHRRLGEYLETQAGENAHAAHHFRLAGDGPAAARIARQLVQQARHVPGFQQAAEICERILTMALAAELRVEIMTLAAEALARAGQTSRAADAYLTACALAPPAAALELRRCAAEHLLRCGRLEDGMAQSRIVAEAVGLGLPTNPLAAVARLVMERARLGLRRGHLLLAPGPIRPAIAQRADVGYSLSVGLAMIDFVTAAAFQTQSTRLSLDCGDAYRAARGLALEACFTAAAGKRSTRRVSQLIERAEALARPLERDELTGLIEAARGVAAQLAGRYEDALARCDAAIDLFRRSRLSSAWEQTTVEQFALWSLGWLGRWDEIQRRLPTLRAQATARADRYASTFLALGMTVCGDLGADRPAEARRRVAEAMHAWPAAPGAFQTPHLHELVALTIIDLYEGLGPAALERLEARWPAMAQSQLMRVEQLAAMMWELRLRSCVAAALVDRDRLDEAASYARRLRRLGWMEAPVALADAAIAAVRGNAARARSLLERAALAGDRDGLALHAAAARLRWGRLTGGDEGQRVLIAATDAARRRGVRRPLQALTAIAPWPGRADQT